MCFLLRGCSFPFCLFAVAVFRPFTVSLYFVGALVTVANIYLKLCNRCAFASLMHVVIRGMHVILG